MKNNSNKIKPGNLVCFLQHNKAVIGSVKKEKNQKFVIIDKEDKEIELNVNRIFLLPSDSNNLNHYKEEIIKLIKEIEKINYAELLKKTWSTIKDKKAGFTVEDLSMLVLNKKDTLCCAKIFFALMNCKTYFKQKKDTFYPREANAIEELIQKQKKEEKEQENVKKLINYLSSKEENLPKESEKLLNELKKFALDSPLVENKHIRNIKFLLKEVANKLELKISNLNNLAYQILKQKNIFNKFSELMLIKFDINESFSPSIIKETEKVIKSYDQHLKERKDLSDHYAITIDDQDTEDMDDAISIKKKEDGYILGIHISDVASIISPENKIIKEANNRGSSIYTVTKTIPMLPNNLSNNIFSLKTDLTRATLSCLFSVNKEFNITNVEITPALIKVKRKLSYVEAEELLLKGDPLLSPFYEIYAKREIDKAGEEGFNSLQKENKLRIINNKIVLNIIPGEHLARNLIADFMILANASFASFAKRNNIPAIFRTQEKPDNGFFKDYSEIGSPSCKEYIKKSFLKPSIVSFMAFPHWGLNLEAYMQTTSPIRRFHDYINQLQILTYLKNKKPYYDLLGLKELLSQSKQKATTAKMVNVYSKRFWLLKYLEQEKEDLIIKGTVVKNDSNRKSAIVLLEDFSFTTLVQLDKSIKVGTSMDFKIEDIKPPFNRIKLASCT